MQRSASSMMDIRLNTELDDRDEIIGLNSSSLRFEVMEIGGRSSCHTARWRSSWETALGNRLHSNQLLDQAQKTTTFLKSVPSAITTTRNSSTVMVTKMSRQSWRTSLHPTGKHFHNKCVKACEMRKVKTLIQVTDNKE